MRRSSVRAGSRDRGSGNCGPAGTGAGAPAPALSCLQRGGTASQAEPISRGRAAGACRKGPRRAEGGRRRGGSSSFHGRSERRRRSRSRWPSGGRETRAGSWSSGRTPPTSTTGTGERGGCSQSRRGPGRRGLHGRSRGQSRLPSPPRALLLRRRARAAPPGRSSAPCVCPGVPEPSCAGGMPGGGPGKKSVCVCVEVGQGYKIGEYWIVPVCTVSVACPRLSPCSVFLQDREGCLQLVHGAAESSPSAYQGGG